MVVGAKEPRLKEALDDLDRLVDFAIICGNNTDPKSEELIKSYGFEFYRDDREWGLYQPTIKTDLLERFREYEPDWIVAKDADEVFDETVTRQSLEELVQKGGIGWYFYVVNLWNDEEHYAKELSFWNIRFFRFAPEFGLEFQKKRVHCGLAPPIAYHWGNYSPHILWHYGLMENRQKKVERYNQYDPNAVYKDKSYYEALRSDKTGVSLERENLRAKVANEVSTYKVKGIPAVEDPEGYVYLTRDGKTIDVPAKDQRRYERQGWEFLSKINLVKKPTTEAPILESKGEAPVKKKKSGTKK